MKYVIHFCKNKKCNNGWVDEDLKDSKTIPPNWKYCEECCKKMGIDFKSQIPPKNTRKNNLKH